VRVLLVAGAIAFAISTRAHADGAGVIAAQGPDRTAVASALANAMTGRAGRIVPDAIADARAAVAAGAVPIESLARFRRVREQADEGWRAYLRVAVESAALRLAAARTEAESLVALPGGAELYADTALRLGVVLDRLGRRTESQAILALAVALDPDRPITLAEFSPDVVDAIAAVRALPIARHKLHITSLPAGAQIAIDGTDVGRAPLDVDVTRGQHLVVARETFYAAAVRGISVDAPTSVTLDLARDDEVVRLDGGAARGMPESAAQELVDATLRYGDFDEIVLAADTSRRGGPTLLVQRCAGAPARCSAVVDIGYGDRAGLAAAARQAWEAARTGELRYPPSVLAERGGIKDAGGCKLCKSPGLWVGVGAAVVLGSVITYIALSSDKPPPRLTVDGRDF
jgi:PEGA domain